MDGQAQQLREFAEGIADLIKQVPVVRDVTTAIRAGNEERKVAEEAVGAVFRRSSSCAKIFTTSASRV